MTRNWRDATLGDLVELKRGYDLPSQDRRGGGVPVVSSSGISGFHEIAKAKGPGVVTGRYGTLGEVFYIEEDFWPLNTTLYVHDFKGNDPRFVSYFLKTLDFLSFSDKAAVPGLNRNHLHQARVHYPAELLEQRAIAGILGVLDDKIKLNRRMSATLESTARALFKSWFIDFDPVRAKAKGHDTGLPSPIADFFPSSLEDSELGEVPKGWRVAPLAESVDVIRGLSYKGSGLSTTGIPMHNLNSIFEGGGYKHEGIKYYRGEYREHTVARAGDLLVANTEQGHDRLLIGYSAIVPASLGGESLFSHHLYRLISKQGSSLTSDYLCYLLNSEVMHDTVSGYANGTTVNMLSSDGLQIPAIVIPPKALIDGFSTFGVSIRQRRECIVGESARLAALRDELLPKILSGEVHVGRAQV